MESSKLIRTVNKDADLGIVGDLRKVIPKLVDALTAEASNDQDRELLPYQPAFRKESGAKNFNGGPRVRAVRSTLATHTNIRLNS
jgi:hypothetical protein